MRYLLFILLLVITGHSLSAQESENKMRKNGRATNKYKGTKLKASSGMYKNAKREGQWVYWYENGNVKAIENYVHDTLEGAYMSYTRKGDTLICCSFLHGRINGSLVRYSDTGILTARNHYKSGELEGAQYFYTEGRLSKYELFRDRQIIEVITYSSTGRISSTAYYQDSKKTGTWIEYGRTKSDTFPRLITQYQNDKRHGYTRRYRKGILIEEVYYAENRYDGPKREWTDEGVMRTEVFYKNDRKDGVARFYFNGKLSSEGNFRDGQPVGPHHFYANEMTPMEKIYYYNDSVKAFTTFYTGRINSERQTFVKNGHHFDYVPDSIITFYANGKVFSRQFILPPAKQDPKRLPYWDQSYTEYSEQGKVILTGTISSYGYSGNWNGYYSSGKKRSVTKYGVDSYPHPLFTAYYPSGKVKMDCKVYDRKVRNMPHVFDEKGVELEFNTPAYNAIVLEETKGHYDYNAELFITDQVAVSLDYDFVEAPQPVEAEREDIFTVVEKMPEFPGGEQAMRAYLQQNMKYPTLEKESDKQGTVYLAFVISNTGEVRDVRVLKEVAGAPGLTKEAIRIVSAMPNWTPGQQNGRNVNVNMTIPIRFVLD
jgi:TonB family protein